MTILAMEELEFRPFQQSFDLLQKASGDGAVDDAMVGRQNHGHQRADRKHAFVGDDARSDLADCQNGALRRIDDRDKTIDAEHTEIGHRESTAFVIERKKFFLLRFIGQAAGRARPTLVR